MTVAGDDADGSMRLPAVLDLAAADDLLATLRRRLEAESPVRLDASGVETLTLPCAQIILAAIRAGAQVSLENPSVAFIDAFDDLGLDWAGDHDVGHVRNQIQPQDASPDQYQDGRNEPPMSKRILTIDDSKTMRDMLMFALVDAGFDVLQAVDGQDGLNMLGKERVDVVITDINMPKMDGYEVIRHMRQDPAHKTTPVLVLTTESDVEKRNLAREAGATGWMVKPFDPDRLVATIRKVSP